MLYYNWLTHGFWTRTGGWEFDGSHGAGTPSPSHWQQVEEQAPKPVDWIMCFLVMTFVPVQELCVDIYVYIYIYICIFYMSSVIWRIYTYNRSVIQYWGSCTPSHSIGLYFWGVHASWVECHFLFCLVYQLCLALWWWKCNTRMFVIFGIGFKQHFDTRYLVFYKSSPPKIFLSLDLLQNIRISGSTWCHRTPSCHI